MKKIYLWSLFLISISVLIFSCRKDYKNFFDPKDDVISSDLEAAKIFHAKGAYLNKSTYAELMVQGSKSVLSTEKIAKNVFFIKLSPLWKDAFEVKAYDGSDLIVVPTPENRLSDKTFEIRRFFIFTKKGGSIVDGKIVEFLGVQYALKDKMNDIIANYKNSSVVDLTGAIFEYDLNYFFLNGEKVVQGKRTGQFSKFNNLSKAKTQSNIKTNDFEGFESGPIDPNVCYELYWSTYINGVMVSATFIGYSDGCYGGGSIGGGGGNGSGYDSASAYQSGGGPYAGNPAPAEGNNPITTLMKNPNSLTTTQKTELQKKLDDILKDCIGSAIYNNLTSNSLKFDFSVNSNLQAQASYSPTNQSITIKDISTVSTFNLQEEFFHAYQNSNTPGGISQYAPGKAGAANIEFEAKVIRDMQLLRTGGQGGLAILGNNYIDFLGDITNNYSSLPTSFTSSQSTQYFNYMSIFIQQNPGYSSNAIKSDLNPTAMFNLITTSSCPTH